jgi:malate dehydrogenase
MRDWVYGTAEGNWTSMAVPSDGSYGIEEGVMYSYPVTISNGAYSIVQGLEINDFSRERMDLSDQELRQEKSAVSHLLL